MEITVMARKNKIFDGKKKCNTCGEVKDVSNYYPYKKSIRGSCKECCNIKTTNYMKTVSKETRSEWWKRSWEKEEYRKQKYKSAKERKIKIKQLAVDYLGGKCNRCGYDNCIEAFEFHHIDPSTKDPSLDGRGINRGKSFEASKEELDKCVLLCANCHREVHYEQKFKNTDSV
jgi:hypothetical protein